MKKIILGSGLHGDLGGVCGVGFIEAFILKVPEAERLVFVEDRKALKFMLMILFGAFLTSSTSFLTSSDV